MTDLTQRDVETIRLALEYAILERASYVSASYNCGLDDAHKQATKLVARFEKLHLKIFDQPSEYALSKKEHRAGTNIFELGK